MKKSQGRIALPAARSAIDRIKSTDPPNVSIENARKILGPELHRLIANGWMDDDIVAAFSDQNENGIRQLLQIARRDERIEQKKRKQAREEAKVKRLKLKTDVPAHIALHHVQGRRLAGSPMLATDKQGPSLALPAPRVEDFPDAPLPASDPPGASPVAGALHPITRNRGVRRPQ